MSGLFSIVEVGKQASHASVSIYGAGMKSPPHGKKVCVCVRLYEKQIWEFLKARILIMSARRDGGWI